MLDFKLLWLFIGLNTINVIIQTVKSIVTVKCGKLSAALTNAVAYGLYTIVTIYMLCDLPLMAKAGVVAGCNLIGVYLVKLAEEKARRDKVWKIEATFRTKNQEAWRNCLVALDSKDISHNYIDAGKYTIINIYAETQDESVKVKEILKTYPEIKYFVTETKIL